MLTLKQNHRPLVSNVKNQKVFWSCTHLKLCTLFLDELIPCHLYPMHMSSQMLERTKLEITHYLQFIVLTW